MFKMQHLEVSGTPVLYIGRTVLKNYTRSMLLPSLCTYLIKNCHNSHLKPHTLKMSVMHN